MLWSPKFSLTNIHVKLTAKGLLRNLQLLSGCKKSTVVFQTVDKNKQKTGPRSQQPQTNNPPDLLVTEPETLGIAHYRTQCEKKNECIEHLKKLLTTSNHRFVAITVVIQRILAEHEEALKQRKELSQELVNLRGELVNTATSCEKLEQEKDELRVAYEVVLQKVQDQHRAELTELEERLRSFYSAEWEKVHEAYQQKADEMKAQIQQQEKIQELMMENKALHEKIQAEGERRKALADKNQKDSHTLYLEQELESLKVVVDIKTKQLHEKDKKLIQMEALMERNVKLDECLTKVQQENEELKARMDRHAALSRQLSTEQAVLQESLQKESKVNKRLSMENEELLWKLHNGDLSSPRKLSPSSPSMSLQSPRNSGAFSSAPVSPR
ncbi:MTS1A protein, partial [Amia calva]|nr:MTS1A protein [Amia calva]